MTDHLIDLSHTVSHGLVTYEGLPAPVITTHLSREASRPHYSDGTEFHIGRIDMVANTGTYLDAPFHRYESGADLSELPLTRLADLTGRVVRHEADRALTEGALFAAFGSDLAGLPGCAVLIRTGWSRHWNTPAYFREAPFVTRAAATLLADAGVALVGIDSFNIDDVGDRSRPAHSILLAAGIPIVEHLCGLDALPEGPFRFFAVPVKVKDFGTFPVRAFAITP
ncbi:MAG: cyclase family protein [Thermoanaerobaculia bacterium]